MIRAGRPWSDAPNLAACLSELLFYMEESGRQARASWVYGPSLSRVERTGESLPRRVADREPVTGFAEAEREPQCSPAAPPRGPSARQGTQARCFRPRL